MKKRIVIAEMKMKTAEKIIYLEIEDSTIDEEEPECRENTDGGCVVLVL
jgi:hypothetical protein